MSVVRSNEDLGSCRRRLEVEVPGPAVEAEARRVEQEFRQRARIQGFRRGKVPLELVRRRFAEEIEGEVVERLVPRYWRQAQAETDLEPMLPPEIADVEYEPASTLRFTATVEVRPAIELGSLEEFDLPDPAAEPSSDEVDRAIDDLRRQAGDWRPVERAAARGDLVAGSLVELSGEDQEGEPSEVEFEVGDPNVWEELSLAVTGAAAGGRAEFTRLQEGAEPGAERRFRIRVEAVKERELPELDAELAKKLGSFESVEELRDKVTESLRQHKEQERRRQREAALIDQLIQRHPLELPEKVVRHETESMLRDYAEELARRGVDVEKAEIDWQRLANEFGPQAQRRVHSRLLLDAVADQQEIRLSESQFEEQLAGIARAQRTTTPALRRALDQGGRLEDLRQRMLRGKTIETLLGEAPEANEDAPETAGTDEE